MPTAGLLKYAHACAGAHSERAVTAARTKAANPPARFLVVALAILLMIAPPVCIPLRQEPQTDACRSLPSVSIDRKPAENAQWACGRWKRRKGRAEIRASLPTSAARAYVRHGPRKARLFSCHCLLLWANAAAPATTTAAPAAAAIGITGTESPVSASEFSAEPSPWPDAC